MGSLARKLKREKRRREFEKLTHEWGREKHFQQEQLAAGEKVEQLLGKKPTFTQFMRRADFLDKLAEQQKKEAEKQKQEEEKKIDLEWKDE